VGNLLFDNFIKILELLSSDLNFLGDQYFKIFGFRIIKEIQSAKIGKDDYVLQIGCGAVPYTSEIIAKYTGAKVVAIDNDPKMVLKAKSYIQKKGISNISIEYGNGIDFPLEKFSVVYLSLGVSPLEPIFKRIIKEGKGKRIVFRVPRNLVGILYNKSANIQVAGEELGGRVRKSKVLFL
jgi:protein-L-isoaspartate O-methyltransferase